MHGSKITLALILLCSFVSAQAKVIKKGACDKNTDDLKCRYDCGADAEQLTQYMCLDGECYCTNIGEGSCKMGNNNDGCYAVCQSTGKASGACVLGSCTCK